MNILLHDFGGYAFPFQLSEALAERGHQVTHAYCASLPTTPQKAIDVECKSSSTLRHVPIKLAEPLAKASLLKRRNQEVEYGKRLSKRLNEWSPEVVLSADAPLDSQKYLVKACQRREINFVYWLQDLLGIGTYRVLRRKLPILGHVVGRYYMRLERSLLRQSDELVLITEDFEPMMRKWGIDDERMHVIPNWAPLHELPVKPKRNEWASEQGLDDKFCFLYSGTLGFKHNPDLLLQLARRFRDEHDVRVVVISAGQGAEWLREQKHEHGLDNLVLLDFQPYERLPDVLATADVLTGILEPDAGVFSVPSKVLTYLCAERPLLLAIPPENLAARIVSESEAGLVVAPKDIDGFLQAAATLHTNPERRNQFAKYAREYAEMNFDIDHITDRFEAILSP